MNEWIKEAPAFFLFVLPGFLAAAVFYEFTAHRKANQFERIVQAAILTIVVQGAASLAAGWNPTLEHQATPYVLALVVGLAMAATVNTGWLHWVLRTCGITRESPEPSPWCAAFAQHKRTHVVLHLRDSRRIYAFPLEWPNNPGEGHFHLAYVRWLMPDGQQLPGPRALLLDSEEVSTVEFPAAKFPRGVRQWLAHQFSRLRKLKPNG